ncbi:MAG: MBL fold metallo-hydrolase [Anaerolineae bacterium]|nr:MBL fold metallo-hydrolase [Anaerolineae bacterium]
MSGADRFSVTFWGVRGGHPVPGPATVRYGGNTTSAEVRAGRHIIIFDAGSGIIPLGDKLMAEAKAGGFKLTILLLLTHTHNDHIEGFPFFRPVYHATTTLNIFGPKLFPNDLEDILKRSMMSPRFPISLDELPCEWRIGFIRNHEMLVLTEPDAMPQAYHTVRDALKLAEDVVKVTSMRSSSHPNGIMFYRVEYRGRSIVFATDTESYVGGDQNLIRFAQGADLLIHDAEFTPDEYLHKQSWGHSTWKMACNVARQAGVKRLALTHHNEMHDDDFMDELEKVVQTEMPEAFFAHEGLTVDLLDG